MVIPTYNKASRIAATLDAVASYLAGKPYGSEIVVVDDGSADGTAEAARAALAGRVPSQVIWRDRNLGKGASVREGVLVAAGELILFCDDDLSTPIEELDKAVAALEGGADVVIGSRALPDSEIRVRQRRPREWMGKAFNLLVRLFVLKGYRDTQCGFKAFRRNAARGHLLPSTDRRASASTSRSWSSAAISAIASPRSRSSGATPGRAA